MPTSPLAPKWLQARQHVLSLYQIFMLNKNELSSEVQSNNNRSTGHPFLYSCIPIYNVATMPSRVIYLCYFDEKP